MADSAQREYPHMVHKPASLDGTTPAQKLVVHSAAEADDAIARGWEWHARGPGVSPSEGDAADQAREVDAEVRARRAREDAELAQRRAEEDAADADAKAAADRDAEAARAQAERAESERVETERDAADTTTDPPTGKKAKK